MYKTICLLLLIPLYFPLFSGISVLFLPPAPCEPASALVYSDAAAADLSTDTLNTQALDSETLETEAAEQTFADVELILQNPELPNGCEVTSLAILLTAAGFPADHVKLYQACLPTEGFVYTENQRLGPSPEEYYVGDASSRTGGWYCFESPIVQAGDAWIARNGGGSRMQTVSGLSQDELEQYVQKGIPLVVWTTIEYASPTYSSTFSWTLPDGEAYVPYSNLHCVVLAGEENGQYQIADPIYGWQTVDKDVFWSSFDAMGRRAVTIQAAE